MNRLNSDSIYSFENSRKFKIQQFLLNLIEFMSILSQSSVSLENEARGWIWISYYREYEGSWHWTGLKGSFKSFLPRKAMFIKIGVFYSWILLVIIDLSWIFFAEK